jgi:hypothetical protein
MSVVTPKAIVIATSRAVTQCQKRTSGCSLDISADGRLALDGA